MCGRMRYWDMSEIGLLQSGMLEHLHWGRDIWCRGESLCFSCDGVVVCLVARRDCQGVSAGTSQRYAFLQLEMYLHRRQVIGCRWEN